MATRYEAIDAASATVSVYTEGMDIGMDIVAPGKIAVVVSYDEVVYIEGTPQEVFNLLTDASIAVMQTMAAEHDQCKACGFSSTDCGGAVLGRCCQNCTHEEA